MQEPKFLKTSDICQLPPRRDPKTGELVYPKSNETALLPISRSAFLNYVNAGLLPKPMKLGSINVWKREEILDHAKRMEDGTHPLMNLTCGR